MHAETAGDHVVGFGCRDGQMNRIKSTRNRMYLIGSVLLSHRQRSAYRQSSAAVIPVQRIIRVYLVAVFTAQCTLVQSESEVLRSHVVRSSVCLSVSDVGAWIVIA